MSEDPYMSFVFKQNSDLTIENEPLRSQLSTLKAILEKKDEALRAVSDPSKVATSLYEIGWASPCDAQWERLAEILKPFQKALALTPETYVKEGGGMNEAIKNALEEAKCELEEQNECGDLEDRLEASQYVAHLDSVLKTNSERNTRARFLECGLCHGRGEFTEYEDTFKCSACSGRGGSWS